MKIFWEDLTLQTTENNLAQLDSKLAQFTQPYDFFFIEDLSERFQESVTRSGIQNGQITAQSMHTTTALSINELDEPMLVMDIHRALLAIAPKVNDYLHNSPMRTKNRCESDYKCDRNADAHIKAFLIGNPTTQVLVREGKLVLGRWQRVSFIDFDGPRERKITLQISGE